MYNGKKVFPPRGRGRGEGGGGGGAKVTRRRTVGKEMKQMGKT